MKQTTYRNGRPRSTHFRAAQIAAKRYHVDPKTGLVFNQAGEEVGENTYEPRVSIRLKNGKKFNVRVNKLVAYIVHGPEALRRGVSVRHRDGDVENNKASNLYLQYNREAAKNLRRRLREQATA